MGHRFDHYGRDETLSLLAGAGFGELEAGLMDDTFVVSGRTREHAQQALGKYLVDMYGLVRLVDEHGADGAHRRAFELAQAIFRYPDAAAGRRSTGCSFDPAGNTWRVTMPRELLSSRAAGFAPERTLRTAPAPVRRT
jgi:hypothetical protein